MITRNASFVLVILLAGCASPGSEYPSLAIRDAERVDSFAETDQSTDTQASIIPDDVLAEMARHTASARDANTAFRSKAKAVGARVQAARGAAIASKAWASAQVAVSELDSHRTTTAIALADLDRLYVARAVELQRRDAIGNARQEVSALLAEQDRILARLKAQLR